MNTDKPVAENHRVGTQKSRANRKTIESDPDCFAAFEKRRDQIRISCRKLKRD